MSPNKKRLKLICVCRACSVEWQIESEIAEGVAPAERIFATCSKCAARKSMLDDMTQEEIQRSPFARSVAIRNARPGWSKEEVLDRRRQRDAERKFLSRHEFSRREWFERLEEVGWFCCMCNTPLRPGTVLGWCTDGSARLENTYPICRGCECRHVGLLAPQYQAKQLK